ncbi:MAG TPA: glycosyltransferase [Bacillota bacterium]|nr:glycosyltransferase [Bacillota bacterium]
MKDKEALLFIVSCELNADMPTGVQTKVFNQKRVFEFQYDVVLVGYTLDGIIIFADGNSKIIQCKNRRSERISICDRLCKEKNIHKCYIRNSVLDPLYMSLLRHLKRNRVTTVQEIATYPYDGELKDSIKHRVILTIDRLYRKKLSHYVERIVTYSSDNEIYGIQCINIHNGIDVFSQPFFSTRRQSNTINLIGVAKIYNWHGFDRMITGLAAYAGQHEVLFHIVGDGPALKSCKELAEKFGVSDKVIFHGFRYGEELARIYEIADIGIDCLGLHRKGMTQVSSLKSREYASHGLPIVCANSSDVIPDDWKYLIKQLPNDEPVNIEYIVDRFNSISSDPEYREEIRSYAEKHFDITKTFIPVLDFFGGLNE